MTDHNSTTSAPDAEAGTATGPVIYPGGVRRVVTAATLGNVVEWYDWTLYATAAVVLSRVFFPAGDATAALLNTFAVFAVGFVARPLGGIIIGRLSDLWGRQKVLSATILMMSLATAAIGILPSYSAVGLLAPILLLVCRLISSISAGGELVGSVSFLIEHLQKNRRGRYLGILSAGVQAGALLAALLIVGFSLASRTAFESWGWRALFLLALPMGLAGLYVRLKTEETPEFTALQAVRQSSGTTSPRLLETVRAVWPRIAVAFGVTSGFSLLGYTGLAGYPSVVAKSAHLSGSATTWLVVITLSTVAFVSILSGRLMDRIGCTALLLVSSGAAAIMITPAFALGRTSWNGALTGAIIIGVVTGLGSPALYSVVSEIFPTEARVTGGSIAYNMGQIVFGGTAPFVLVLLSTRTGSPLTAGWYSTVVLALTFVVTILSRGIRRSGRNVPLSTDDTRSDSQLVAGQGARTRVGVASQVEPTDPCR